MNAPAQGRAIKDVEDLPFKSASPSPILNPSGFARTMEINAHVISGLDPGAIPGGSTKSSQVIAGKHGADQHRQTCKGDCFLSVWYRRIGPFSKCER